MDKLPRVIATSVVRSAHQGESHGGVYLIDLNSGQYDQVIDWNDESINWEGRGGDRGLRGIAFHNNDTGSNRLVIADRKNRINLSMFLNTNRRRYRTRICQTITLGRGSPGALSIWRRCGYRRFIPIHRFRLQPGHRKADFKRYPHLHSWPRSVAGISRALS